MNREETTKLLTIAAATDNRIRIDAAVVNAWTAILNRCPALTFDAAMDALLDHKLEEPGVYVEPGHIVKRWRIARARDREVRGFHPLPPAGYRWAVDAIETGPRYKEVGE